MAVGTNVIKLAATDADLAINAQITYTLDSSVAAAAFSINATTGQLQTASAMDFETTRTYAFNAIATDGKYQASAQVEITVGNLNDNIPMFAKAYLVNVSESSAVSSHVVTVTATDKDPFGALSYSLLNNTATFSIDSQSGEIKTTVGLDRETKDRYVIAVEVTDGGSPSFTARTNVTVTIDDVNDNAPYFVKPSATVSVPENVAARFCISVNASDKDTGVNGMLKYFIVTAAGSDLFTVDKSTGVVSTAVGLDREKYSSHVVSIVAKDKGNPSLTSQPFVLSVNVIDANDNVPLFVREYNNETISEGANVGTGVFEILAKDLDVGINAEIVYSITGGNTGNVFKVDNKTG